MNKIPIAVIMLTILLVAGCSSGSSGLGGLAITLGGNLLCGVLQGIPFIGEYCGEIIGIIFGVDAGTIEVRRSNGQWVTLTSEPMELNLLGDSPQQQLMVFKELPPGTYDKIRIDLKDIKVVTKNGIETTILPSQVLEFDTNIVVDRNGKSLVELNIDIANSLHITDDNKVVFAPVLDVESKRNVDFEVVPVTSKKTKEVGVKTLSLNKAKGVSEMGVDVNRETAVVKSGVTFDKRKVGMDLNGNMKKNFVLDKNLDLTITNNKVAIRKPTVAEVQPIVTQPKVETNTAPQNPVIGAVVAIPPKVNTIDDVPSPTVNNPNAIQFIINAKKWLFTPTKITMDQGDHVMLKVVPSGLTFSFAIPQLGISKFVSSETTVEFTANQAGTFEFKCSSCEEWRGMKGTLVVESDYVPPVVEEEPALPDNTYIDDDAILGNSNAPVTIVEWSDYECPFCARFFSQTLPLVKSNYIDTGKVKFVYRDFPLSFHPNAQKAAEAAECAGDQEKYWQMHDKLFENGVQGGGVIFKQYAQQLGLNTASFNSCLDSGEKSSEVQDDFQDGQTAGVQGTPGFLINGQLVSGAQPYSVFEQVIEAKLSK